MVAYAGEPTKAAILKRLQKKHKGMFNPKAKLDTSQVIDLRSELAKMMVPGGKRSSVAPLGLGDYVKNSNSKIRPRPRR